jgi:hypothetical protein
MASKRYASQKEALAYPVLDVITGGAERGYNTKEANVDQMYLTLLGYGHYKRWSKKVVKGYFLESTPVIHFLNAMPEYREAFEEMTKHGEQLLSSIVKYDEIRMKLVEDIKKNFVDLDANFETDFIVLDDRQEQLFQDLKANPDKINTLKARSIEIQEELEGMSRAKALNPLRKTLREELDSIIEQLKLVKEV